MIALRIVFSKPFKTCSGRKDRWKCRDTRLGMLISPPMKLFIQKASHHLKKKYRKITTGFLCFKCNYNNCY